MVKTKTTLSLNKELVERAKKQGINISEETEKHLKLILDTDKRVLESVSTCVLCNQQGTLETNYCFMSEYENKDKGVISVHWFICPECFDKLKNGEVSDKWEIETYNQILNILNKAKKLIQENDKSSFASVSDWICRYNQEDSFFALLLEQINDFPLARFDIREGRISIPLQDLDSDYKEELEGEKEGLNG